jgi:hypothetical protein
MPGKRGPAVTLDLNQIRKDAAKRRADRKEAERKSKELDKGAVERGNREQAREAESLKKLRERMPRGMKCGGKVHKMAKGGKVNHKGCGIAKRGLTKGRMV